MISTQPGVWINDDGTVGEPDPSNPYRYVGNGPTNATDPSGFAAEPTGVTPLQIAKAPSAFAAVGGGAFIGGVIAPFVGPPAPPATLPDTSSSDGYPPVGSPEWNRLVRESREQHRRWELERGYLQPWEIERNARLRDEANEAAKRTMRDALRRSSEGARKNAPPSGGEFSRIIRYFSRSPDACDETYQGLVQGRESVGQGVLDVGRGILVFLDDPDKALVDATKGVAALVVGLATDREATLNAIGKALADDFEKDPSRFLGKTGFSFITGKYLGDVALRGAKWGLKEHLAEVGIGAEEAAKMSLFEKLKRVWWKFEPDEFGGRGKKPKGSPETPDFERGPGGARKHTPGHRPDHIAEQAKKRDAAKRANLQSQTEAALEAVREKWNALSDQQRKLLKGVRGVDPDVTRAVDLP